MYELTDDKKVNQAITTLVATSPLVKNLDFGESVTIDLYQLKVTENSECKTSHLSLDRGISKNGLTCYINPNFDLIVKKTAVCDLNITADKEGYVSIDMDFLEDVEGIVAKGGIMSPLSTKFFSNTFQKMIKGIMYNGNVYSLDEAMYIKSNIDAFYTYHSNSLNADVMRTGFSDVIDDYEWGNAVSRTLVRPQGLIEQGIFSITPSSAGSPLPIFSKHTSFLEYDICHEKNMGSSFEEALKNSMETAYKKIWSTTPADGNEIPEELANIPKAKAAITEVQTFVDKNKKMLIEKAYERAFGAPPLKDLYAKAVYDEYKKSFLARAKKVTSLTPQEHIHFFFGDSELYGAMIAASSCLEVFNQIASSTALADGGFTLKMPIKTKDKKFNNALAMVITEELAYSNSPYLLFAKYIV